MNMYEKASSFHSMLKGISEELDISESRYVEAENRYKSIGEWLGKSDSEIAQYDPKIYAQGSFSLGTMVKPISNKEEYDVDLVCLLANLDEDRISQKDLKAKVGDRLKMNKIYEKLLEKEGKKCWTLDYENEFHMDILPSIPDLTYRKRGGIYQEAILITDKKRIEQGDPEWPKSNPKGYLEWFMSRQNEIFIARKTELAKTEEVDVEDIPNYRVKTPLQKAVQILKRHRDMYYIDKDDQYKPISVIITTLSARQYNGQDNVYNAIYDILSGINEDMLKNNGKYEIKNPANDGENFADRWNKETKYASNFLEWVKDAKKSFCAELLEVSSKEETDVFLRKTLGVAGVKVKTAIGPIIVNNPSKPYGVE